MIRLKTKGGLAIVCDFNGILFDKKPFIVKPLLENTTYEKESLTTLPVWVRFHGLSMHYWGEPYLNFIARE